MYPHLWSTLVCPDAHFFAAIASTLLRYISDQTFMLFLVFFLLSIQAQFLFPMIQFSPEVTANIFFFLSPVTETSLSE